MTPWYFKVLDAELKIGPKDVVYITGDSGSGKSVLLRAIRADLGEEAIDLSEVVVDPEEPLIETVGATVEEGLELLSKVGLNDAFLFLRPYGQLSDGQKYRYRIAKLIESGKQWWLMDEFAACLDRDTAKIIAFNLQKIARQQGKAVIAATTHSDLQEDLKPNVLVNKRFGEEIQIDYYPTSLEVSQCSLVKEMRLEEGTREDWQKLSVFHYRGHKTSIVRKIYRLVRGRELCGVIVYCYPPPACFGRRMVLPRMSMAEINKQLSIINRLVIHPKYRTVGLGAKLIRESMPLVGTDVELIAVMAKYSPFAEKAGMKRIADQVQVKSVLKISEVLASLGFDVQLLGSQHYVKHKLDTLDTQQLLSVREVFIKNAHPRLKKEVASSRHQPYGKTADYVKFVEAADSEKLAKLIKTLALLLQTKVYLFWRKQ